MIKSNLGKYIVLIAVLIFMLKDLFSQDTIRVMHYNLMYYGKNIYDCNSVTNSIDEKNNNLKTIIQHVKPDIFSVNELDGEGKHPIDDDAQYLLDNALNTNGVGYYRKVDVPKIYLANTIFYNADKLRLKENIPLKFNYGGYDKIFTVLKLYYNAEDLAITNDTAFVYCYVAHLKAGSYVDSENQRTFETNFIMDYFETLGQEGNYLILGDFNVYTPTETAFQNLINPENSMYAFNDPANQIGEWSGNYDYRYYHTQSTHTSGECFSLGGMDDRFDFILASNYIMNGSDHLKYIDGTYKTIGQDGSNFNGSLNISTNTVVPTNVAKALYNMSDHLPVYLELEVDQNRGEPLNIINLPVKQINVHFNNPASEYLHINISADFTSQIKVEVVSINGLKAYQKSIFINTQHDEIIPVNNMSNGMYLLNFYDDNELIYSSKFIIKN